MSGTNRVSPEPYGYGREDTVEQLELPTDSSPRKQLKHQTSAGWHDETDPQRDSTGLFDQNLQTTNNEWAKNDEEEGLESTSSPERSPRKKKGKKKKRRRDKESGEGGEELTSQKSVDGPNESGEAETEFQKSDSQLRTTGLYDQIPIENLAQPPEPYLPKKVVEEDIQAARDGDEEEGGVGGEEWGDEPQTTLASSSSPPPQRSEEYPQVPESTSTATPLDTEPASQQQQQRESGYVRQRQLQQQQGAAVPLMPVQPQPVERAGMEPNQQGTTQPPPRRPPSSYANKGDVIGATESDEGSGCCSIILTGFSYLLVILFFPLSLLVCIKVVQEYERAVIFRLGRLLSGGAKGPGIFFVLPCIEDYTKIDLRTVTFDIPPQEVLTRDSVTVSVDAVVYYRIYNPTVSVANVANAAHSTQLLAQTTLRNVLGTKNLGEILSDRDQISESMQTALDEATDRWGIKVERVEIKDVRLPIQLQRAMAAEAEAAREARAKVIAAEGEQKASRALKEAADIISESPAALQLRYLQTLNSISAEKNSTIIFPLPIDLLKSFIK